MNRIYILQKQTNTISNSHFENVKACLERDSETIPVLKSLIRFLFKELSLDPLDFKNKEELFSRKEIIFTNRNRKDVLNNKKMTYKIVTMIDGE